MSVKAPGGHVTIRAVAEQAGNGNRLMINYSQSKEPLRLTMTEDVISRYLRNLLTHFMSAPMDDLVVGLRAFIENFVEFAATRRNCHGS